LKRDHTWIKSEKLPLHPRDITLHYAYVCIQGFKHAIDYCEKCGIIYEFIGLLDADTVIEEAFFEKLIVAFQKDRSLGILSGGIYYDKGELEWERAEESAPRGSGRLWRKRCFIDTGGYLLDPAMHTISNSKAVIRGYKIKQLKSAIAIQKRKTSGAEGLWKGYKMKGWISYYLDKHISLIILNTFYYSLKKPYYTGIAFLYGYIVPLCKREKQVCDEELRQYYRKKSIKKIWENRNFWLRVR
jgi:GT2 family glycosyltransferase